ncbi:hypothetical protein [Emticicia sp. BO119]|uniref:hypothetical protein n=1 Tax=Emticicia sp. BO119 TaxID=2757768 RepID=UPI0015F0039F|nr:hypothetical protein [Emticicia sp. BO119]MBA4851404.1 hypothetical protein [Emticicia sp. BO119]
MTHTSFPYSYWTKILGLLIIMAGIFSFFQQYLKKGVFDVNELALGFSWGLVFIFFSKEKTEDEMMQGLKFKALTRAIIVAFFITHFYNYLFLNWNFKLDHDVILSISAYQFMALTLIIATVSFYYLKHQITLNEEK